MDKSKYLYRNVVFSRQGNTVSLVDINDPDKEALQFEPWLGVVVALADGNHTVGELVDFMARQYQGDPPADLERTLESVIERLNETKMIRLTDEPVEMPYYLSLPVEQLDLDRARRMMAEDARALDGRSGG